MAPTDAPAIHPQRAADLARRADAAADDWRRGADRLHRALVEAGERPDAARRLAEAAEALAALGAEVRAVVARVAAMEAGALPGGLGLTVWHGLHEVDGLTDAGARSVADEAFAAWVAGDADGFLSYTARFGSDPRFAAALAGRIDPGIVATELAAYRDARPAPEADGEARRAAALAAALFHTLATASLVDALPFDFAAVQDEVARRADAGDPRHANQVALLFAPAGIVWGERFVGDAVRRFVLPRNDTVTPGIADAASWIWWPGPTTGPSVDARPLVLAQLAHHREEAARIVVEHGPERLFGGGLHYDDRGAAAAELLVAATDPRAAAGPAALLRVVGWLGGPHRPELQPAAQARLGQVVVPYLGSFRSGHARFGATHVSDPVPELDPDAAARALAVVAEDATAAGDLSRFGMQWLAHEVDALVDARLRASTPYAGEGMAELGDVWGRVAGALHHGDLARGATADDQSRQINEDVKTVVNILTVPFRAVSNLAAFGVAATAGTYLDANLPVTQEVRVLGEQGLQRFADRLARLKLVVLSRWWQSSGESAIVPGAPPADVADVADVVDRLAAWQLDPSAGSDSAQAWLARFGDAYALANG